MNKLEKPKFITTPIWSNAGLILGIFACFKFSNHISDISLAILMLILVISLILLNLIRYIINWHKLYENYLKFYKDYQTLSESHLALSEEYRKKQKLISNNEKLILQYQYMIDKILNDVSSGILPVTDYEKKYLENLQSTILKDKEYLYNLEGGNENGRKNL